MILLGLTGSIGMGKSTTAQMFADAGAMVYDADAAVHALYAVGGEAGPQLRNAFPGVVDALGAAGRAARRRRRKGQPARRPARAARRA